ncbi:MAG: type I methionyl aminopeptidase [Defluviitaleaceae bacterium]|nr:type I methionyl aminopeptidase [Defluviitaleaceae bacterium]
MAINIRSEEQIELMRKAGKVVSEAFQLLESEIRPGIGTNMLNEAAERFIKSSGAIPSFFGYRGFPSSICISVNEQVIHGIPGLRKLRNGDIVSIDIGVYLNGFHADAARTFAVGDISDEDKRLIEVTKQSFFEGIKFAKANNHLSDVSSSIQQYVESNGFSVVRDYVGHGIGRNLHEDPAIPNYETKSRGPKLMRGMVLAIEPMVNAGTYEISVLDDKWTVITGDGKKSAHYENTVVITDDEPELLTL